MNLRRWLGLSDEQRQAMHDLAVADVRHSLTVGQMVNMTPGAALQSEGVDQSPSTVQDDEITEAANRLIAFHKGPL